MKFDGLVSMTYIYGSIFIFLGTFMRFSLSATESGKIARLINAIKVVGLRKRTPAALGMLVQYTGILWLWLGTAYGIIYWRFGIEGIIGDYLLFLVIGGPLILLVGVMKWIQKYYWQRQK